MIDDIEADGINIELRGSPRRGNFKLPKVLLEEINGAVIATKIEEWRSGVESVIKLKL